MSTLSRQFVSGLRKRAIALKATAEKGLQTVEWIFLVVGILALAAIVIVAVNAFVQAQIGQLPG